MKVAVFSTKPFDREFLERANSRRHELRFFQPHVELETAPLAAGSEGICGFVNEHAQQANRLNCVCIGKWR